MNRPLAAAMLAIAAGAPVAGALADPATIQARQGGFRVMNDSMEAIQAVVQARRPNGDALAPARAIVDRAARLNALFPPGSDRGAPTRALPTVWSDRGGFERRADALAAEATLLVAAAQGGDPAVLARTLEATGQTCIACHREHRARQR